MIVIEPHIDMARIALNVSDSMVSGLVTGERLKEIDMTVYNSKEKVEISE